MSQRKHHGNKPQKKIKDWSYYHPNDNNHDNQENKHNIDANDNSNDESVYNHNIHPIDNHNDNSENAHDITTNNPRNDESIETHEINDSAKYMVEIDVVSGADMDTNNETNNEIDIDINLDITDIVNTDNTTGAIHIISSNTSLDDNCDNDPDTNSSINHDITTRIIYRDNAQYPLQHVTYNPQLHNINEYTIPESLTTSYMALDLDSSYMPLHIANTSAHTHIDNTYDNLSHYIPVDYPILPDYDDSRITSLVDNIIMNTNDAITQIPYSHKVSNLLHNAYNTLTDNIIINSTVNLFKSSWNWYKNYTNRKSYDK